MGYARLCVADQAVWPEIGYVDLKSVVTWMEVAVDPCGVRLLPERSQRRSIDANACHLVDRSEIEPNLLIGEQQVCVDVNRGPVRRGP